MNLFGQKSKIVTSQKLIKRSGIHFLILFVLMDAIFLIVHKNCEKKLSCIKHGLKQGPLDYRACTRPTPSEINFKP